MTNEERRKAAIEELRPLLEVVKRVRDKYGLARVEVRARNYNDAGGKMGVIGADDDSAGVEIGEVYGLSLYDYEDDYLGYSYEEWHKSEDDKDE